MLRWIPYAFVRIVLIFLSGILVAIQWPELFTGFTALTITLTCAASFLVTTWIRKERWVNPGLMGLVTLFFAGYLDVKLHDEALLPDHVLNHALPISYYQARIQGLAEEKDRSWKLEACIVAVKSNADWYVRRGKVLLYLDKVDFPDPFRHGDLLLVKGRPQPIKPPSNPGVFDYKSFLAFRNIYHQQYLRAGTVKAIAREPQVYSLPIALAIRQQAVEIFSKFIDGTRERALASALVLGVKDGLDNEMLDAYAATGSMHILAVSGLHVGILYWMILILFKPIQRFPASKWLMVVVSMGVLWGYALITGMSPSVLRAVTMFSFMALAKAWSQRINPYNIIAVAAFCQLLLDPYQIMYVGFQLSYLAVIGIISVQPVLYRLWEPKQLVWDQIWKLSSVAIAAQLATFSLGLLYFHQFPTYFFLSNLFVIPGAFAILVLGLATLAFSFWGALASIMGWLLGWIIKVLNTIVFALGALPFSQIENVYIDGFQCTLMVGMLIAGFLFLHKKRFTYLIAASVFCVCLATSFWIHFAQAFSRPALTIYNIKGHTAMEFTTQGKSHFYGDETMRMNPVRAQFDVQPNRQIRGIRAIYSCDSFRQEFIGCAIMVWNHKRILHLQNSRYRFPDTNFDYVIVSNNAIRTLSNEFARIHAKEIILDSSNSIETAEKILNESGQSNVKIFSVLHQGAYTVNI